MINGLGTFGGVALRIIEDFTHETDRYSWGHYTLRRRPLKRMNRYTLDQFIEVVVHQQRSILSDSHFPSYLWWHLTVDKWGEIVPEIDMGKLSPDIYTKDTHGNHIPRKYKMLAYDKIEQSGPWELLIRDLDTKISHDGSDIMARYGMSFGQRFLTRYSAKWYGSYDGESDIDEYSEILYASVPVVYDIPVSIENRQPEFKGFSLA